MKKTMTYIIIALILILTIWIVVTQIAKKALKDIDVFYKPHRERANELILRDIDFSDGNYVLYIKHEEYGEFAVVDKERLQANKDSLKIKGSLANYLPGRPSGSYGVLLFKDNQLIKDKIRRFFSTFEIGNLKLGAVPVKEYEFYGVKSEVKDKIDTLKTNNNAYMIHQPDLPQKDREFSFQIFFPSIAIPVIMETNSTGHEKIKTINGIAAKEWRHGTDNGFNKEWVERIEKCIRNKAGTITEFDIDISHNTVEYAYLFEIDYEWEGEGHELDLRNKDRKYLRLKDLMYYKYHAYIRANREDAEKLLAIDYSDCISENDRNRPQVIALMKDIVKQSIKPNLSVEKGEVGLQGYRDFTSTSGTLEEQQYQLNWLEIESEKTENKETINP